MTKRILLAALLFCAGIAHATVPNVPYTVSYTCTGTSGPFAFSFPISDPTAMTVTINGVLIAPSGYSVVALNVNFNNGGIVQLGTAGPCPVGQPLTLTRVTPVTQLVSYYDNMPIPNVTFGRGLDKLTEIAQEITGGSAAAKVASLQMQNNGTNFLTPATGPVVLNFTNCTVSGSLGLYSIACGGSGGLPSGTGVVRVASGVGSAAELSGDATTSGSNAVSVVKINGGAPPTSKAFGGWNSSGQPTDASTTFGSSSVFGIVKVDGTTITASGGVISAVGGGGSPATTCVPGAVTTLTDGATVTWAIGANMCANAYLTFTTHGGSRTLVLTGMEASGNYVMNIQQDGTGGEGLTLSTGCTWKVAGGGGGAITPSTGAGAIDVLTWWYDGTNCYAVLNKNFS